MDGGKGGEEGSNEEKRMGGGTRRSAFGDVGPWMAPCPPPLPSQHSAHILSTSSTPPIPNTDQLNPGLPQVPDNTKGANSIFSIFADFGIEACLANSCMCAASPALRTAV